jgi:hypothetical protein
MTINISQISPFMWILAAVLVIIVVFAIIRFFWRHVLKFVIQAGLAILVIVALLALLRYFKVF